MQVSKSNRVALYASAFLVVVLVLFAILRDNANPITLKDATNILNNHTVKQVIVSKDYVYLKTPNEFYKIASSQVTPKMFVDYEVKVETGTSVIVYLLFLVLFLSAGSLIFRWYQKQKEPTIQSSKNGSLALNSDMSEPIKPIKSDVTFSDIGGIADVKI